MPLTCLAKSDKSEATSVTVTKDGALSASEINAISGATITSKAVTNAVNTARFAAREIIKGGKN